MNWPVVPICERQLRDVNPADLLNGGLYRRCNTYKGGGGYDQFPAIYKKRFGHTRPLNDQFVVQLKGCYFNCPYCYVTRDGVNGEATLVSTEQLVSDFIDSGCSVFHLMGGAPDIYYEHWSELMQALPHDTVFHSDLMLCGHEYKPAVLKSWNKFNYLYAVSIKGGTTEEFRAMTRTDPDWGLMLKNLLLLYHYGVNFYVTFTGMTEETIHRFKGMARLWYIPDSVFNDSFTISIKHYKALDEEVVG